MTSRIKWILAGMMFFVLASMPNKAMAEEGWQTVWNAQADTIVAKGVVTSIDLEPEDALASPDLIKITVKEVAGKEKKNIFVPKSFAREASVGDTVTVLMRFASEEKREGGSVLIHPVLIYRHEVTVTSRKK